MTAATLVFSVSPCFGFSSQFRRFSYNSETSYSKLTKKEKKSIEYYEENKKNAALVYKEELGLWDGSVDKDTCHQAW